MNPPTKQPPFKYILVLDFEATCDDKQQNFMNEIIEFPTIVVNTQTGENVAKFHHYVQPTCNKMLTDFCRDLTGIKQQWIDDGDESLIHTLRQYHQWLLEQELIMVPSSSTDHHNNEFAFEYHPENTWAFCTCGDWDLKTMLYTQAKREKIELPSYYDQFINIKTWYEKYFGRKAWGMSAMLENMGLSLEGRHHSGIDDCFNIAKIVKYLLNRNVVLGLTYSRSKGALIDTKSSTLVPVSSQLPYSFISLIAKPSKKEMTGLATGDQPCTHIVSILHPTKDGAKKLGKQVEDCGMTWIHVPIAKEPLLFGSNITSPEFQDQLDAFNQVISVVKGSSENQPVRLAVHCTSMNARSRSPAFKSTLLGFALLKHFGHSNESAIQTLRASQWRQVNDDFLDDTKNRTSELQAVDKLLSSCG